MREWGVKLERMCGFYFERARNFFIFFFRQHVAVLFDCSFIFLNKSLLFLFFFFRYIQEFFVRCVYNSSMYALLLEL